MSLTVAESSAVNALCRWLLGDLHEGQRSPSSTDARDALSLLTNSSHKRLMAGYRPGLVSERWGGVDHDRIARLEVLLERAACAIEAHGSEESCATCVAVATEIRELLAGRTP